MRSGFVVLAFGLGIAAIFAHDRVHAQSADAVLCDRVAADPDDPDRPADTKGVQTIAAADVPTAIKFCRNASGSSRRAMYNLGRAHVASGQTSEAIAAFRKAADKGSTTAMVELGVIYANGSGVPKDAAQARKLFEKAAQAGNARGAINLAALTEQTGGKPMDPVQKRQLLAKAAEGNSPEAQYQLGLMVQDGAGGPKNDAEARVLFEKAAAQNHPGGLERAGAFALGGRGGPKDSDAGKAYLLRASALGNEDAKATLKRAECPITIGDKKGKRVTDLCF